MIVAEPRTQTLNGETQAAPDLRRAIRGYVRHSRQRSLPSNARPFLSPPGQALVRGACCIASRSYRSVEVFKLTGWLFGDGLGEPPGSCFSLQQGLIAMRRGCCWSRRPLSWLSTLPQCGSRCAARRGCSPESGLRGQSSNSPFRTAQTTISCFEATPSFT